MIKMMHGLKVTWRLASWRESSQVEVDATIAAKANIRRAEVTVMLQQLLKKSDLM
ncbi:hypothetical protein [Paenibacillus lentus]|uniref:hypothetical protein n=1 Tax=Paenibacillus lentus TaxID=1338368 RepID=UPI0036D2F3FF